MFFISSTGAITTPFPVGEKITTLSPGFNHNSSLASCGITTYPFGQSFIF